MTESRVYEVRRLSFAYPLGGLKVPALNSVDTDIHKGEFICLSGPSGSGKSTLLNLLGLIEHIQAGSIQFLGQNVSDLSERQKNHARRYRIGFVFQTFQLFSVLTADENVEYFLARQGLPRKERRRRVDEALAAVGLSTLHRHKPMEMSGGQRQRVAIARALAKQPEVIIADEPTANLDQATGRSIMQIFQRLNRQAGVTIVASSHDPMVQAFASRLLNLVDGKLC